MKKYMLVPMIVFYIGVKEKDKKRVKSLALRVRRMVKKNC